MKSDFFYCKKVSEKKRTPNVPQGVVIPNLAVKITKLGINNAKLETKIRNIK
jgi:hypothetical protein